MASCHCIPLSNGCMTGFMSHGVLCLYSCTVLCDYLFNVLDYSAHVASNLAIQSGSHHVRGSGYETSCNPTMKVFSLGTKSAFLLVPKPSPTSSLQYVKQMMASCPGPILHKCWGRIALFPTNVTPNILPKQKCWRWQRPGNEPRLAKQVIKNWRRGELWDA